MDCIVHGVAKSWTQLSNCHFHFNCVHSTLSTDGENPVECPKLESTFLLSCLLVEWSVVFRHKDKTVMFQQARICQ